MCTSTLLSPGSMASWMPSPFQSSHTRSPMPTSNTSSKNIAPPLIKSKPPKAESTVVSVGKYAALVTWVQWAPFVLTSLPASE